MHKIYELSKRSPERKKLRIEIVALYNADTINRNTFCKQHSIKAGDLSNWIARHDRDVASNVSLPNVTNNDAETEAIPFIPLETTDNSNVNINLEIHNKYSISFSGDIPEKKIINLLKEIHLLC